MITKKRKVALRVLVLFLCVTLVLCSIPISPTLAFAADSVNNTSDEEIRLEKVSPDQLAEQNLNAISIAPTLTEFKQELEQYANEMTLSQEQAEKEFPFDFTLLNYNDTTAIIEFTPDFFSETYSLIINKAGGEKGDFWELNDSNNIMELGLDIKYNFSLHYQEDGNEIAYNGIIKPIKTVFSVSADMPVENEELSQNIEYEEVDDTLTLKEVETVIVKVLNVQRDETSVNNFIHQIQPLSLNSFVQATNSESLPFSLEVVSGDSQESELAFTCEEQNFEFHVEQEGDQASYRHFTDNAIFTVNAGQDYDITLQIKNGSYTQTIVAKFIVFGNDVVITDVVTEEFNNPYLGSGGIVPFAGGGLWEVEPNNTYSTANATYDDWNNWGYISSASDVDWYYITFTSAGSANFWMEYIPSGCNYDLEVYSSNGTTLLGYSRKSGTNPELITMDVTATRYYIKVYSQSGYNINSNYLMRVKNYPNSVGTNSESEPNNTYSQANALSDNVDKFGQISSTSDIDWYYITFSKAGSANFFLGLIPTGCDYELEVYSSNGTTKLGESKNNNSADETVTMNVSSGVRYYLKVYSHTGSSSSYYKVRAKLVSTSSSGDGDRYEPNDSRAAATDISNNMLLSDANIHVKTDYDYYKFTVNSRSAVSARLFNIPSGCDYDLYLMYSSSGSVAISPNGGNKDEVIITTIDPGTYYLQVSSYEESSSSKSYYTVQLSTTAVSNPVVVNTRSADMVTSKSLRLNGRYSGNTASNVEYGFIWGTSNDMTNRMVLGTTSASSGDFRGFLSDLPTYTCIYYQAFVGDVYSQYGTQAWTLSSSITSTTVSYTNLTSTAATLRGSFANNTGTVYYGFYFGTTLDPQANFRAGSSSASSLSSYSLNTTDYGDLQPNTTYYYRSYAGDAVGNVMSFTTSPAQVATPTASPAPGTYTSAQNVTLSCATSGATIRYTTNGSDPTSSSTLYSSAISVSTTTTIKAKAFRSGMTDSATGTFTYTINIAQVATPTASPPPGTYNTARNVELKCATAGATIRYTTNGSEPTSSSTLFKTGSTIPVASTTTIKAKAFLAGMSDSNTATFVYTITPTGQIMQMRRYEVDNTGAVGEIYTLVDVQTTSSSRNTSGYAPSSLLPIPTLPTFSSNPTPGLDDRKQVTDTSKYPYSAIADLIVQQSSFTGLGNGTGFMVSSRVMLSAAHNFNYSTGSSPKSIKIYPGRNENTIPPAEIPTAVYIPTDYYDAAAGRNRNWDFAIVVFDDAIGNSTGWLGMSMTDPDGDLTIAGYPSHPKWDSDKPVASMWVHSGPIILPESDTLQTYRIDGTQGQSGGPIFSYSNQAASSILIEAPEDTRLDQVIGRRINSDVISAVDYAKEKYKASIAFSQVTYLVNAGDTQVTLQSNLTDEQGNIVNAQAKGIDVDYALNEVIINKSGIFNTEDLLSGLNSVTVTAYLADNAILRAEAFIPYGAPEPASIAFIQAASATIPVSGSVTATLLAQVKDQYGDILSECVPSYSLYETYSGVSVNSTTGVVTVQANAEAGHVLILAKYENLPDAVVALTLSKTPSVPSSIAFTQDAYSAEIPSFGSDTITVAAQLFDQYGEIISGILPNYSLQSYYSGVSIDSITGAVTVQSTAEAGKVNIRASYGTLTAADISLTLTKAASVATSIAFTQGSYSATIPASGSTTATVLAQVKDQFDNLMSDCEVIYLIEPSYSGVSIDSRAGVVTIQSTAAAGTVNIQAKYDTLQGASVNLTLNSNIKAALSAVINEALALSEVDYTTDSWAIFVKALAAAQDVERDEGATQAQIDIVLSALVMAMDNLIIVNKLQLAADAHEVTNGDYFKVTPFFKKAVKSNTAILDFAFDKTKFEFRDFYPANGVILVAQQETENGLRITVMLTSYNMSTLGEVQFFVKENIDLENEDNEISVTVNYIEALDDGTKVAKKEVASTIITTVSSE